jgi:hypothetical protein
LESIKNHYAIGLKTSIPKTDPTSILIYFVAFYFVTRAIYKVMGKYFRKFP